MTDNTQCVHHRLTHSCWECVDPATLGYPQRRRIVEAAPNPERKASVDDPFGLGPKQPLPPAPDGPGAPAANPSEAGRDFAAHIPAVRVAAPIEEVLASITAICTQQVGDMKRPGRVLNIRDIQSLEQIAKTLKVVRELDKEVQAELRDQLGAAGDKALSARAEEIRRQLEEQRK